MTESLSSDCRRVLRVRLLGPLSISAEGIPLAQLHSTPMLQGLLGYLILHRGQWLDRSRVAGTFWPEVTEEKARRTLNTHLWRLRRFAQGHLNGMVHSRRDAIMWQTRADCWLDLEEWDALTRRGTEAIDEPFSDANLERLERQHALYRGPLLDGIDLSWCEEERYRYAAQNVAILRTMCKSYEARGELERALRWARRWVEAEPYEEEAHTTIIRLHQRNGQPVLAHHAYQRYQILWSDLGVPFSSAIAALFEPQVPSQDVEDRRALLLTSAIHDLLVHSSTSASPSVQERLAVLLEDVHLRTEQAALDIAALHERTSDWRSACRAYETGVTLAEQRADAPQHKRHFYTLRLKLDGIYDRLADRDAQRNNSQLLLTLAEELGCSEAQSEAWARRCWLDQRVGHLDSSLYAASRALSFAGSSDALRAQALRLLGSSHDFMGSFSLSVRANREALTYETRLTPARRLSYTNLVSGLLALNDPWQALNCVVASFADMPGSSPTLIDILALGNGAVAHLVVGRFSTAEQQLRQAITYAKLLGARELEAWLLARSATLYRWIGASQRALFAGTEGWKLARNLDNHYVSIEAAIELALLAGSQGDRAVVSQWIERIEESPTALARGRHRGRLKLLRAYLAAANGDYPVARTAGMSVLEHIEQTGEERLRLPTLALLARLSPTDQSHLHQTARAQQSALLDGAPDCVTKRRYIGIAPLRQWADAQSSDNPPLSWLW